MLLFDTVKSYGIDPTEFLFFFVTLISSKPNAFSKAFIFASFIVLRSSSIVWILLSDFAFIDVWSKCCFIFTSLAEYIESKRLKNPTRVTPPMMRKKSYSLIWCSSILQFSTNLLYWGSVLLRFSSMSSISPKLMSTSNRIRELVSWFIPLIFMLCFYLILTASNNSFSKAKSRAL